MIGDALTELDGELLEADLCIVGAGAAGITLARALADGPLRVVVLEGGGYDVDAASQSLYEGAIIGRDYFPLDATRLRYFGGTTGHWGGMCAPLAKLDFEERSWVERSGWPFGLTELEPYYSPAHEVCEIASDDYRPQTFEELVGSQRLPLDPARFVTHVIRYSPPTRFGERYRAELQTAKNVSVLLNANALELVTTEAADRVTELRCTTIEPKEFRVVARAYVLATGGIENARLLLLSNRVQAAGLGNANDLVGRHFMEHPHRFCGMLAPEDRNLDATLYDHEEWRRREGVRASFFIAPSQALQCQEQLLNGSISVFPVYESSAPTVFDRAEGLLDRVGRVIQRNGLIDHSTYHRHFQQQEPLSHFEVSCAWEQTPNPLSRVKLAEERDMFGQNRVALDWRIARADEQALERALELFGQEVGRAGIGRLKLDIGIRDWPAGNHHMGTTRMHADPHQGVVNAECRVHGVSNLYVAGSSVFPTSGGVNPTLTIVALAERMADLLAARLRN